MLKGHESHQEFTPDSPSQPQHQSSLRLGFVWKKLVRIQQGTSETVEQARKHVIALSAYRKTMDDGIVVLLECSVGRTVKPIPSSPRP